MRFPDYRRRRVPAQPRQPRRITQSAKRLWKVRFLATQLKRHAEGGEQKDYVDDEMRDLLIEIQQEWKKLHDKLSRRETWQNVFQTGIILNSASRKEFARLDELYLAIGKKVQNAGDEPDQFLEQATVWGEEIASTVEERTRWGEEAQGPSVNSSSASEGHVSGLSTLTANLLE